MCNPLVVARWRHAVMAAQGFEAVREVGLGGFVQVLERRGQAVSAMIIRCASECPKGILQPFRQCDIAFAAQHDMGMLEPAVGKPEVIQAML